MKRSLIFWKARKGGCTLRLPTLPGKDWAHPGGAPSKPLLCPLGSRYPADEWGSRALWKGTGSEQPDGHHTGQVAARRACALGNESVLWHLRDQTWAREHCHLQTLQLTLSELLNLWTSRNGYNLTGKTFKCIQSTLLLIHNQSSINCNCY